MGSSTKVLIPVPRNLFKEYYVFIPRMSIFLWVNVGLLGASVIRCKHSFFLVGRRLPPSFAAANYGATSRRRPLEESADARRTDVSPAA